MYRYKLFNLSLLGQFLLWLMASCSSSLPTSVSSLVAVWTNEQSRKASTVLMADLFERPWYDIYLNNAQRRPSIKVGNITISNIKIDKNQLIKELEQQLALNNRTLNLTKADFELNGEVLQIEQQLTLKLSLIDIKTERTIWVASWTNK